MDSRPEGHYFSFVLYAKGGEPSPVFSGQLILSDHRPVRLQDGSFTVRVWVDPKGNRVRGTIHHEETGHSIHFQSGGRVADFIQGCLAAVPETAMDEPDQPSGRGGEPSHETTTVSATIIISNQQRITLNRTLTVEAYDMMDVIVPSGASDMAVELSRGSTGQVCFLLVTSDHYGERLTYRVEPNADGHKLDGPHFLVGTGLVGLLDPAPDLLYFTNTLAEDARIEILIGRDAAPQDGRRIT